MRKITLDDFISKSKSIHGDKYDYGLSEYRGSRQKVLITCPIHGEFHQTAAEHMRGCGCPACGYVTVSKRLSKGILEFEKSAKKIHGDKYNYSNFRKVEGRRIVDVTCGVHGLFTQSVPEHLGGHGCKKCGNIVTKSKTTKSNTKFIEDARRVHGDKYTYENVLYRGAHSKVIITCDIHGYFEMRPSDHIRGSGCKFCSQYGFDLTKRGVMYTLMSEDEKYFKIGITGDLTRRLNELKRSTPFKFRMIDVVEGPGEYISNLEKIKHSECVSAGMTGFDGCTEWFLNFPENNCLTHSSE